MWTVAAEFVDRAGTIRGCVGIVSQERRFHRERQTRRFPRDEGRRNPDSSLSP